LKRKKEGFIRTGAFWSAKTRLKFNARKADSHQQKKYKTVSRFPRLETHAILIAAILSNTLGWLEAADVGSDVSIVQGAENHAQGDERHCDPINSLVCSLLGHNGVEAPI